MTTTDKVNRRPVSTLDVLFKIQTGAWQKIFERQTAYVQMDVLRALAADKFAVYMSCPLGPVMGGVSSTNAEIAESTAQRLTAEWGGRFWFLNPGQYQMQTTHGAALLEYHARELAAGGERISIASLPRPDGGDYMCMWARVLAEDDEVDDRRNLGGRFSAYYFVGPSDVHRFFTQGQNIPLSSAVEAYFARKVDTDRVFSENFSPPFCKPNGEPVQDQGLQWEVLRKEFIRYYVLRAGAEFSKGCHDEWNIWVSLNQKREDGGRNFGSSIPGFFDGRQIDPVAAMQRVRPGYAVDEGNEGMAATEGGAAGKPQVSSATSARAAAAVLAGRAGGAR